VAKFEVKVIPAGELRPGDVFRLGLGAKLRYRITDIGPSLAKPEKIKLSLEGGDTVLMFPDEPVVWVAHFKSYFEEDWS
jgi:hypothetical protein